MPGIVLGKEGTALHLGRTVELAMVAGEQVCKCGRAGSIILLPGGGVGRREMLPEAVGRVALRSYEQESWP